jgi:drug/metabolite transporter (DMT)-like permease
MPSHAISRSGPDRRSIALGMLVLYLVWGSTYLAIAVAVDTIPPFLMAGARFLLAGFVLLAIIGLRGGEDVRRPTRREWRDTIIVGALLLGGGMGMVAWGEQTIPSGIAALLIALLPVWVALLGALFLHERLPRLAVVGIVVGFVGVGILVGPTALGQTGALDAAGLAAILISPIAWSSGSLFASHRARLPRHPLVATGTQMLAGGVVLMGMAAITGEFGRFDPTIVTPASILAFLYLAIIGSLLAFTVYGWMLRVAPLPLIATYAYVNPVVAVILGALILQEPVDLRTIVAGAVIVGAVALIVTARGRMRAPTADHGRRAVEVSPPRPPSEPRAEPAPSRSASG